MTHMTPDEARAEMGIIAHPDDPGRFFGQAIRALETLAADTLEYKVETLYNGHWREPNVYADYYWTDDYYWAVESLAGWQKEYPDEKFRIVCRRVSEPWEVTHE